MSGRHFFKSRPGLTVGDIVAMTGAEPVGTVPLDFLVRDVGQLETAGPADLVYLEAAPYAETLSTTEAGVCLTVARFEGRAPKGMIVLRSKAPFRDYVMVMRALYPDALRPSSMIDAPEGSKGATVHPSARLEDGVTVEPGAVIGPRAGIGAGTLVGAHAVIGPDVQIGRDCAVGAGATIMHALIGDNVILYPGCRIGQDGFRYHPSPKGHVKVPQIGRVIIQDNVEIGANTSIDRGGNGDTVIGEGTKIDNLVQIGHNVTVGRHCIIVSQSGLSGSAVLGDYVMLGGQVGIADHVKIGEGAMVAAKSGVMSDIPAGERWGGTPAMPLREYFRLLAASRRQA